MANKTVISNLDPTRSIAAAIICPTCGHLNEIRWIGNEIEWWPNSEQDHCMHYQGNCRSEIPRLRCHLQTPTCQTLNSSS